VTEVLEVSSGDQVYIKGSCGLPEPLVLVPLGSFFCWAMELSLII